MTTVIKWLAQINIFHHDIFYILKFFCIQVSKIWYFHYLAEISSNFHQKYIHIGSDQLEIFDESGARKTKTRIIVERDGDKETSEERRIGEICTGGTVFDFLNFFLSLNIWIFGILNLKRKKYLDFLDL